MKLDQAEVTAFFDEAAAHRPLIPDSHTLSGWGKYLKYERVAHAVYQAGAHTVLDVGCNIGHVAHFVATRRGNGHWPRPFVAGVDLSLASLQRARVQAPPLAAFAAANGHLLPFPDHCFDFVVCLDVLEHVAEQPPLLREIARVLKHGGRLFLATPNPHCLGSYLGYQLYRFLRALNGRPETDKDRFVNRKELLKLLAAAGFQEQTVVGDYLLPRPFIMLRDWVLTPPLPPQWGLAYQKFCNKVFGLRGENLPVFLRDRVCHTLAIQAQKE